MKADDDAVASAMPEKHPYEILCDQARSALMELQGLHGEASHPLHVFAMLVTTPPPTGGKIHPVATVLVPSDLEMGGMLAFSAMMALKQIAPDVFKAYKKRMNDSAFVGHLASKLQ